MSAAQRKARLSSQVMEDPDELLSRVLDFAQAHSGIEAVVQTGSRARGDRVDALSDLDIELIGPAAVELVGDDEWPGTIADVLISVHLANEGPDAPDWPTYLVVFTYGRKIDFTLAGTERIERMTRYGLDGLYQRGYLVRLDKTGVTRGLPASSMTPPERSLPDSEKFAMNQREFWFEATQVPIYLARGDLWPAGLREAEMRSLLLTMLEWNVLARSHHAVDVWHDGHHLDEWLPERYRERIATTHTRYDATDMLGGLRSLVDLYADVAAETSRLVSAELLDLRTRVHAHITAVMNET